MRLGWVRYVFCIIVCKLCGNHLISARNLSSETELTEALAGVLRFVPTLIGNDFTREDEKVFAKNAKLDNVHLKIDEIIPKYGYAVEKYHVTTEDGYILSLLRIPSSGRPVFLMHGLLLSADDWVTPGPENGIAFLLAAEGFDVWLGNARGTKYSRRHLHLSPESAAFWDFSWDEIGRYDLPAMIDFILNTTRKSQLTYIGHSQGGTTFFVMGSEKPEYNNKVSLMIGLAAAAEIPNIKSPFLTFLKHATFRHPEILIAVIRKAGLNELKSKDALQIMQSFATAGCVNSEIAQTICSNLVFVMCGFSYPQLNVANLPTILSHTPAGASIKQIQHYSQTVTFGKFQKFDYGATKNRRLYGIATPPEYDIRKITTPVALFYSAEDWMVTERDSQILRSKLSNVVGFYKIKSFNHLDFVYSADVRKLILLKLLELIKK